MILNVSGFPGYPLPIAYVKEYSKNSTTLFINLTLINLSFIECNINFLELLKELYFDLNTFCQSNQSSTCRFMAFDGIFRWV